ARLVHATAGGRARALVEAVVATVAVGIERTAVRIDLGANGGVRAAVEPVAHPVQVLVLHAPAEDERESCGRGEVLAEVDRARLAEHRVAGLQSQVVPRV